MPLLAALLLAGAGAHASSALIEAARTGDVAAAEGLLKNRVDVNAMEADGSTALLWSTYQGNAALVRTLIRAKADVNAGNRYGITPLLQAARVGNSEIVEALLQAGAKPDIATRRGETPLMAAAGTGSVESVELLLARGVDVNAREQEKSQTALMWAAAEGHAAVVSKLLAAGADPNLVAQPVQLPNEALKDQGRQWQDYSRGGLTALMYAAREGHLAVADALVERGARLDIRTPNNLTALNIAVINDSLDLAARLLERGADPNDGSLYELVQLNNVKTTTTIADATRPRPAQYNQLDPVTLAKLFVAKGADPDRATTHALNIDGKGNAGASNPTVVPQFAFATALANKDVAMLKVFLEAKAVNPDVAAPGTVVPLVAAIAPAPRAFGEVAGPFRYPGERDTGQVISMLIDAGADVNAVNAAGEAGLHRAAQIGDLKSIEQLAKAGARLDLVTKAGLTPLDLAMGKRPPPEPGARPQGLGGPRRDGPQPQAVVLLRQLMGLPPLPADQLPQSLPGPGF